MTSRCARDLEVDFIHMASVTQKDKYLWTARVAWIGAAMVDVLSLSQVVPFPLIRIVDYDGPM